MNSIVMNTSEERTDQKRCCTFLIEDTCFAIESDNVTEVLQRGVINKVPLAAPAISGLLNLRGRIVPAIDLRIFLEYPPATHSIKQISLIVDISNEWYCFLVDKLLDVKAAKRRYQQSSFGSTRYLWTTQPQRANCPGYRSSDFPRVPPCHTQHQANQSHS